LRRLGRRCHSGLALSSSALLRMANSFCGCGGYAGRHDPRTVWLRGGPLEDPGRRDDCKHEESRRQHVPPERPRGCRAGSHDAIPLVVTQSLDSGTVRVAGDARICPCLSALHCSSSDRPSDRSLKYSYAVRLVGSSDDPSRCPGDPHRPVNKLVERKGEGKLTGKIDFNNFRLVTFSRASTVATISDQNCPSTYYCVNWPLINRAGRALPSRMITARACCSHFGREAPGTFPQFHRLRIVHEQRRGRYEPHKSRLTCTLRSLHPSWLERTPNRTLN
jgi:hypothetical protein